MADEHFYVVVSYPIRLAGIENMHAGIIVDSLIGLLERIFWISYVCCKSMQNDQRGDAGVW